MPADDEAPQVDGILRMFVNIMNEGGVQVGITVLVGGTWISGTLIPPRMFMEEAGAYVVEKAGADAEGLRVFFREVGRLAFPSESEAAAGAAPEPQSDREPYHLHLRNARSVSETGKIMPSEGCYLRVRLTEVAGWFIGDLGPDGYKVPPPPRPAG